MVECVTIQLPKHTLFNSGDCCGTRSVIQKCELAEGLANDVALEEGGFGVPGEDFSAVE